LSCSLTNHPHDEHHMPPSVSMIFSAFSLLVMTAGIAGFSANNAETSLQEGQQNKSPALFVSGCRVVNPQREQVVRDLETAELTDATVMIYQNTTEPR